MQNFLLHPYGLYEAVDEISSLVPRAGVASARIARWPPVRLRDSAFEPWLGSLNALYRRGSHRFA